ncbi:MAG: HvfC/BufC family peptide modification chaperone [Rhodanobacteraceae bacterium]
MHTAPSLLECQRRFMAALYAPDEPGPIESIAGNGLEPAARMRIYRHSCEGTQVSALRTTYPGVLALVGAAFFDQCARGYRRAYASHSGNLQAFGGHFADYLATVPGARTLPYLPDVARLEWLRQQAVLAADAEALSAMEFEFAWMVPESTFALHPSVQRIASPHAVLSIFRYALEPGDEGLQLPDSGENVLLWREDGEVAMAAVDAASFACIDALACGQTVARANAAAQAVDPAFDVSACMGSFAERGLLVDPISSPGIKEPKPCR